jgi:aerobic carbon-monoxide dehydrogenase medium subunit
MKPASFEYESPTTVVEALSLLQQHGEDAKILAGGQSLVPLLNLRLARPGYLIDINRVKELDYIRSVNGGLAIGAMTRQRAVERSKVVASKCALLREAVLAMSHPQIRNRGTIGGSLAHADPSAELPAVMVALDAQMTAVGPQGKRAIPAEEFFVAYLTTALEPGELLTEVSLPAWPARTGWSFLEVSRQRGDFALVGVAVILTLDPSKKVCQGARIVLTGVGGAPVRRPEAEQMLVGKEPSEALFEKVGLAAAKGLEPDSDIHASAEYRKSVASVVVQRALRKALERVKGGA